MEATLTCSCLVMYFSHYLSGAINATAHSIQVTPRKQTPPPTLKDFINPQVGDKVLSTDNLYQQERLAGESTEK